MIPQIKQTYSIPVATIKTTDNYSYSATDTVQDLKEKIFKNEGIPVEYQRLYVQYGWRKLWAQSEISDKIADLLIDHLQTASKINLYMKLRGK